MHTMLARIAKKLGSGLLGRFPARIDAQVNVRAQAATDAALLAQDSPAADPGVDIAAFEARLGARFRDLERHLDALPNPRGELRTLRWTVGLVGVGLVALIVVLRFV